MHCAGAFLYIELMIEKHEQPTEEIDPCLVIIEQIQMHYHEYKTAPDGMERKQHMDSIDELLERLLAVGYTAVKATTHGTTA